MFDNQKNYFYFSFKRKKKKKLYLTIRYHFLFFIFKNRKYGILKKKNILIVLTYFFKK